VKIIVVDFVKENLMHAKNVLGDAIDKQVFLVHGDATALPFSDLSFDGYWTVQTLQHIPNFKGAIIEGYRVLKNNGVFANYSLNDQSALKTIYKLIRKQYHSVGFINNAFYLERFSKSQIETIKKVFGKPGSKRYSEIIFKPSLKFTLPGKANLIGKVDSWLSSSYWGSSIARQMSYHVRK
jgi:ubiquinone/menaquinone biosynthesis C-methylase UbiE